MMHPPELHLHPTLSDLYHLRSHSRRTFHPSTTLHWRSRRRSGTCHVSKHGRVQALRCELGFLPTDARIGSDSPRLSLNPSLWSKGPQIRPGAWTIASGRLSDPFPQPRSRTRTSQARGTSHPPSGSEPRPRSSIVLASGTEGGISHSRRTRVGTRADRHVRENVVVSRGRTKPRGAGYKPHVLLSRGRKSAVAFESRASTLQKLVPGPTVRTRRREIDETREGFPLSADLADVFSAQGKPRRTRRVPGSVLDHVQASLWWTRRTGRVRLLAPFESSILPFSDEPSKIVTKAQVRSNSALRRRTRTPTSADDVPRTPVHLPDARDNGTCDACEAADRRRRVVTRRGSRSEVRSKGSRRLGLREDLSKARSTRRGIRSGRSVRTACRPRRRTRRIIVRPSSCSRSIGRANKEILRGPNGRFVMRSCRFGTPVDLWRRSG